MSDDIKPSSGIFVAKRTTLREILAAGWKIEHGTGSWWFRHTATRAVANAPQWVHELISQAEESGARKARHMIRQALNSDQPLLGYCVPFNPPEDDEL